MGERGPFVIDEADESDEEAPMSQAYGATQSSSPNGVLAHSAPSRSSPKRSLPNGETTTVSEANVEISLGDAVRYGRGLRSSTLHNSESDILIMAQSDEPKTDELYGRGWRWWEHPRLRANPKTVLGSLGLTVVGAVLLVYAVVALSDSRGIANWVFFFAGLVCFIPGIYHIVFIICALQGRQGFQFQSLPTFN